ncbi:hypothetical protein Tco_0206743 [Tanacetum coccineum]
MASLLFWGKGYLFVAQVVEKEPAERRYGRLCCYCVNSGCIPEDLTRTPPPFRKWSLGLNWFQEPAPVAGCALSISTIRNERIGEALQDRVFTFGPAKVEESRVGLLRSLFRLKLRQCSYFGMPEEYLRFCCVTVMLHWNGYGAGDCREGNVKRKIWRMQKQIFEIRTNGIRNTSGYDSIGGSIRGAEDKSAHFLPMKKTDGIEKLAQLYLKEIVCRHGVPVSVIYLTETGAPFRSFVWAESVGRRFVWSEVGECQSLARNWFGEENHGKDCSSRIGLITARSRLTELC